VKAKRAQSSTDDETWKAGGVAPTLNGFDNNSDTRATVIVTDGPTHALTASASKGATEDGTGRGVPLTPDLIAFGHTQGIDVQPSTDATPTLRANGGGADGSATTVGVRRLTPRECERLQGWPDDHTRYTADGTEVSDSARYRMVGNGVAAPVAKYVAKCIEAILGDLDGR